MLGDRVWAGVFRLIGMSQTPRSSLTFVPQMRWSLEADVIMQNVIPRQGSRNQPGGR